MIGEKLLQKVNTGRECFEVFNLLNFPYSYENGYTEVMQNQANRLVELNNEVYEKLHSRSFIQEKLSNIIDAEKQELLEQMNRR